MAHLTCKKHKRRIVAVAGKFMHRNGDGSDCNSPTAGIMGEEYTAQGIQQFGMVRPPRSEK